MNIVLSKFATALGLIEPLQVVYTHRSSGASGVVQLVEPFALLGRVQQCSVRLDDPSVSKKHAYIQVFENRVFVVDLNSRLGLQVDGVDVTQCWLDRGQVLRVGDYDVQIAGSATTTDSHPLPTGPQPVGQSLPLAVALTEGKTPLHCPLRSKVTVIGRHTTCNLRLLDERLSSFHATVIQTPSEAWLVDLLGTGGTRLNGRLVRSARLNLGDRISLNGIDLELQLNRPAESHTPADERLATFAPNALTRDDLINEMRLFTLFLAKMYTAMHQDQSTEMKRQTDLLGELLAAVKNGQIPAATPKALESAPNPGGAVPPEPVPAILVTPPPPQVARPSGPAEEAALADAHHWFMNRLRNFRKTGE